MSQMLGIPQTFPAPLAHPKSVQKSLYLHSAIPQQKEKDKTPDTVNLGTLDGMMMSRCLVAMEFAKEYDGLILAGLSER